MKKSKLFSNTKQLYNLKMLKSYISSKLNPIPKRYGNFFENYYKFLNDSQFWSKPMLEAYQMEKLTKLLIHCYKNVPYYEKMFNRMCLKPSDIQNHNDLKKLPLLTKHDVQENLSNLTAKNIPKSDCFFGTTSGSTGTPLGLYIEKKTSIIRAAFDWRFYNWSDYVFEDKCLVLRGIVPKPIGNLWEYDPIRKYLILSTYEMTDKNMLYYVEKIEKYKPKVIRGYPSALELFSKFIKSNNLEINKNRNIKSIFTSSENIYPIQKEFIENIFKSKISDIYGNVEQSSRFGECKFHDGYHEFLEYGITEIIRPNGKPIQKAGEIGEIVSTNFTNYVTPLIRYKTGDLATRSDEICQCGRELPLIKNIEGRIQDLIILKDRSIVRAGFLLRATSSVFSNNFDEYSRIKRIQFVQDEKGKILARIVRKNNFTMQDAEKVRNIWLRNIDYQLEIKIEFVDDIPLSGNAKHKFLIQKIPIEKNYGAE